MQYVIVSDDQYIVCVWLLWQRGKVVPTNRGYEPSRVVHLRNLPEDIDMDDVMELGRPFGPVISALRIKETQVLTFFIGLHSTDCCTFVLTFRIGVYSSYHNVRSIQITSMYASVVTVIETGTKTAFFCKTEPKLRFYASVLTVRF